MSRQPRHVLNLLIAAGIAGFAAPSLLAGNDPDSYNEFANARYQGIEGASVQLEDGRWEGEPYAPGGASRPAVGLVEHFVLNGDLDGDGEIEAVVLLWQSSGGSGTFDHVAVMKKVDGDWLNVATAPLGDRVQVRGGAINGWTGSNEHNRLRTSDPELLVAATGMDLIRFQSVNVTFRCVRTAGTPAR